MHSVILKNNIIYHSVTLQLFVTLGNVTWFAGISMENLWNGLKWKRINFLKKISQILTNDHNKFSSWFIMSNVDKIIRNSAIPPSLGADISSDPRSLSRIYSRGVGQTIHRIPGPFLGIIQGGGGRNVECMPQGKFFYLKTF